MYLLTCVLVCVCVRVCVACESVAACIEAGCGFLANALSWYGMRPWLHRGVLDCSSLRSPAPTIPWSHDGHMARRGLLYTYLCVCVCVCVCLLRVDLLLPHASRQGAAPSKCLCHGTACGPWLRGGCRLLPPSVVPRPRFHGHTMDIWRVTSCLLTYLHCDQRWSMLTNYYTLRFTLAIPRD